MSQSDASNIPANLEKAHVEEAYARWAPIYDLVFTLAMKPGRLAAAGAADRPGGLVLDVGVGTGLELPMFSRQTRLIGVDLSAPMLERAKMRVKAEGLTNVEDLLVMDAMALEFPDNHFDAVVAPFVLTVVPDPEATLAELARVVLVDRRDAATDPRPGRGRQTHGKGVEVADVDGHHLAGQGHGDRAGCLYRLHDRHFMTGVERPQVG